MKIILHCEPNTPPVKWDTFCTTAPAGSIAIDGYVHGRLHWEPERRILNLNHHEEVDRLSTRCTAAQLLILLRMGMLEVFKNLSEIHVFFNDCDEDVSLTIWILRNAFIAGGVINPIVNRITSIEDALDTTAGAYGFPTDMPGSEENNWIFWPYKIARQNGTLSRRNPAEFITVIDDVGSRITQAVTGNGQRTPLDSRYTVLSSHPGWSLVEETGLNARIGMYADGINAFVSVRSRPDGRCTYSIGRKSVFIPFNIPNILEALNKAEGCTDDCWGGGDTIAGSPRSTGSRLSPDEVAQIVNQNK